MRAVEGVGIAIPLEDLVYDSSFDGDDHRVWESFNVSCGAGDDVLNKRVQHASSPALHDCAEVSRSDDGMFRGHNDQGDVNEFFKCRSSKLNQDLLNSHAISLEQMLFDRGQITGATIMLDPSDFTMMASLKNGWCGTVALTTCSTKEYDTRVRELKFIARCYGYDQLIVVNQNEPILSKNVYCGMHGVHVLAPNGFGFEINPYFADISLNFLSSVSEYVGDDGYNLFYDRRTYDYGHFFSHFSPYYRYPWSTYCQLLAPGCDGDKMAGSMFYCSRRLLNFDEVKEDVVPPYVDALFVPILPPYQQKYVFDETLSISSDAKYVYDIKVPCTYPSKKWRMIEIAKLFHLNVVPLCRVMNDSRDGYLALPNTSCLVPAAKGAILGIRRFYSKFEKHEDLSVSYGTLCSYDPMSQVSVVMSKKHGCDDLEVLSFKTKCRNYYQATFGNMVRLPIASWSTVCKGKFGEVLCVVTEYPRFASRMRGNGQVDHQHVTYYDVVNRAIPGKLQSTIGCTSLVRRGALYRESVGLTLVEYLNEVIYNVVGSGEEFFVFDQARFVSSRRDKIRRIATGEERIDPCVRKIVTNVDDVG
jgi:hypothetical protein